MRKLDTARVFERLFEVYREQFTLFFPAAIIIFLPVALLNGAFAAGGGVGLILLGSLISIVATYWLEGMVIEAVRDIQDGRRDFSLGELFHSVVPVLPTLIGVGLLAGLGILVGFALLVVPGLILVTIWAVVIPSVVIERRGLDAFGRSRQLVRGNGWRVFGVIVVVFLIQFVASAILSAIFGGADSFVGQAIASLVSGSLIAPIAAIAAALVYLELRAIHGEQPPPAGVEAAPAAGAPAAAEPPAPAPGGFASPEPQPQAPPPQPAPSAPAAPAPPPPRGPEAPPRGPEAPPGGPEATPPGV